VPWFFAVAERDHELQNPTSRDKILLLGERLRLTPDSRVLDLACGKAGPAVLLASTYGCHVVGVERAPEFVAAARERVTAAGLGERVEIVEGDAEAYPADPGAFDAALCLGASFVWHGLDGTLAALSPSVRAGGHVVVGEPYWRTWPLPESVDDQGFLPLDQTVRRIASAGLALVTLIASSEDDWDTYNSLHWRALEQWLADHPADPDTRTIRERHEAARAAYLDHERALLGWAIFVGRRPSH
jgi:SAM-dependent methyltransferase